MEQMSLWGDELPPGYIKIPAIGETMEKEERWANGDCSPRDLEALAQCLLGQSETRRATNGQLIWFRCIATRIHGDHVIETLRRIEPLVRGYDDWVRERRERGEKVEDEKDEEY